MNDDKTKQLLARSFNNDPYTRLIRDEIEKDRIFKIVTKVINISVATILIVLTILFFGDWPSVILSPLLSILPVV
jgi:hypothetical protein